MSKIRINDLARELEVKSKAILDVLPLVGVTEKKTHSSSIEVDEAEPPEPQMDAFGPEQALPPDDADDIPQHIQGGASEEQRQRQRPQAAEEHGPVHPPEQHGQEDAADGQFDEEGDASRSPRRGGDLHHGSSAGRPSTRLTM